MRSIQSLPARWASALSFISAQLSEEEQEAKQKAGNDAAIRAAIVYSLFSCCKAAGINTRAWLEDILLRLPGFKDDIFTLLPGN